MNFCCPTLELSCLFGFYSELMNYDYQLDQSEWPLACTLADDVLLEITYYYIYVRHNKHVVTVKVTFSGWDNSPKK